MGNELYNFLKSDFDDNEIESYECFIKGMLESFLMNHSLTKTVEINENIINYVVLDVLIDLKRLKNYHLGKDLYISSVRRNAFFASFIIKRKPLYDEKLPFINESFAKYILLSALIDKNVHFWNAEIHKKEVKRYIDDLDHHLKYRNINPQTLELAIRSLEVGIFHLYEDEDSCE